MFGYLFFILFPVRELMNTSPKPIYAANAVRYIIKLLKLGFKAYTNTENAAKLNTINRLHICNFAASSFLLKIISKKALIITNILRVIH